MVTRNRDTLFKICGVELQDAIIMYNTITQNGYFTSCNSSINFECY